jgi:hypothetical protein
MIRGMNENGINQEIGIHGRQWDKIHGGYFSDPAIAAVFLAEVRKAITLGKVQVVADLGGGTGYLLAELAKDYPDGRLRFVNVDLSAKQLTVKHPHIFSFQSSVAEVKRGDLGAEGKGLVLMMRSVLHYFGREGALPILQHFRAQMEPGEFFVHQTACFESPAVCRCLNRLYGEMGTHKWYPLTEEISGLMEQAGWAIRSVVPGPTLHLTSEELEKRYNFNAQDTLRIREKILGEFGEIPDFFVSTPTGFRAALPYRVFTCQAI